MISKIGLVILLIFSTSVLFAQASQAETITHNHSNEHENDHHDDKHEIGVSLAPVYFLKEKELSMAVHMHYTYNIPETKFGLGLAYEHIFDEHRHNFLGVEGSFRPVHPLSFSVTPGITYEGKDFDEKQFAVHFETAYEFELSKLHVGPALEFAYHREDFHISLGLHFGFGF